MSLFDFAGLLGAFGILAAYAGVQLKRLDPHRPPALLLNLVGASLVLVSLIEDFNLAALLLEIAWIAIALQGLAALALRRR
ncbi:MAG: hypothetical protein M3M95_04555 [Pseudomonadota bacterium]|nr:hypothetical protein [Pseudomonadota bacterium]